MEVFSEPLSRRYRASCCSFATICNVLLILIIIIIPYLWAFTSQSFWLKSNTYREQPEVSFRHKVVLELAVMDSALEFPYTTLMWSTDSAVNNLFSNRFRPAVVLANPNDDNGDAKADWFNITVDVPLSDTESVVGVTALAFFDYQLDDRVSVCACASAAISLGIGTGNLMGGLLCNLYYRSFCFQSQ